MTAIRICISTSSLRSQADRNASPMTVIGIVVKSNPHTIAKAETTRWAGP
jgi:hypothetical protein